VGIIGPKPKIFCSLSTDLGIILRATYAKACYAGSGLMKLFVQNFLMRIPHPYRRMAKDRFTIQLGLGRTFKSLITMAKWTPFFSY